MARLVVIGAGAMGLAAATTRLISATRWTSFEAVDLRRHGGSFRFRWPVDRALLSFRVQTGCTDLRPPEGIGDRRQVAVAAHLHGLFQRRNCTNGEIPFPS